MAFDSLLKSYFFREIVPKSSGTFVETDAKKWIPPTSNTHDH